jgi:iron complex outermembrane receptor protein
MSAPLRRFLARTAGSSALGVALLAPVAAASPAEDVLFREATFEELAKVTITSVSKREAAYFRTAAAIHVITAEEIRRSGAASLVDALRLAPGLEVGLVNSRTAAVTLRGFNGLSANKLLPLVDGRSLYSLRFGGTIWDMRELPLEDIAQIEVIGGPAGTTWGANAVNGVINIITKSARETQGTHVATTLGTFHRGAGYVRQGVALADDTWLRVYLSAFHRADSEPFNRPDNNDAWNMLRAGLRIDRERADGHTFVSGEVFDSKADQLPVAGSTRANSTGGHLLARHRQNRTDGAWQAQVFFDTFRRDSGGNRSSAETLEIDTLYELRATPAHLLSWGGSFRASRLRDAVNSAGVVSLFDPEVREFNQGGAFVQDEFTAGPVVFTAGVKAEYNDFTNWEILPSLRLGWDASSQVFLWVAASRAARIPSRVEYDQSLAFSGPGFSSRTFPSPDLEAEVLHALEAGARWHPDQGWTFDVSLYLQHYRKLVTNESTPVVGGTETRLKNLGRATSAGLEAAVTWQPREWWRLQAAGNLLDLETSLEPGSRDTTFAVVEGVSPKYQFSLRSSFNLPHRWEADLGWRYVGRLDRPGFEIPAYQALDARVGRQFGHGLEVSLVGQNLLAPSHREFRFFTTQAAVARGAYIRVDWRR